MQVVFNSIDGPGLSVEERDEIFRTLISKTLPAIKAVLDTTPVSRTLGREKKSLTLSKNSGGLS